MANKKWVQFVLTMLFSASAFTVVLNFIVDPFQQYRIADWYMITGKKQRYITPGLAKNSNYDTVLIGSSMVENFDLSLIDAAFDTKSLNLPMAGMSAHEMNHLLKTVIRSNSSLRKVILSLDVYELSGEPDRFRNGSLPLYLYDDIAVNDIKYLLNEQTLKYSLKMLTKNVNQDINLNIIWNWKGPIEYSRNAVTESYKTGRFNKTFEPKDYRYEALKKSFNFNILPYIKDNPNVSFIVYYPPYSYIAYKDMLSKRWLPDVMLLKRYLAMLNINNLNIFDFQCVSSITNDLSNYKDITHFSPEINKYIISSLRDGKHRITPSNLDECIRIVEHDAAKPFELSI